MRSLHIGILCLCVVCTSFSRLSAEEKVYYDVVQKIMDFEFANSHVMENASWLCDVYGPRSAKSPSYRQAAEWCVERLKSYGLENAHLEEYEFGNGWDMEFVSVHMVSPRYMPIIGFPVMWSAGTDGRVRASVVHVNFEEITSEADLEQYRGKLKDRILLISPKQEITPHAMSHPATASKEQLDELSKIPLAPRVSPLDLIRQRNEGRGGQSDGDRISKQKIVDFVFAEGAIAIVRPDGRHSYGAVAPSGYNRIDRPWRTELPAQPTQLVLAVEHYNRMMRILEKDIPVEMEIEIRTKFHRGDPNDFNVIAEIPGTDLAHEIVVLGGHLESVPVGSGAIDNAAGSTTSIEAIRILKAIGVKPRRTIRMGLWGGHDGGGLAGNRGHVRRHFADPVTKEYKKDYKNVVVYLNQDIGPGRIRGVSIMGSEEMRAIFSAWIKPLHNLGMAHLFTTGTTHDAYAEVGLPGFYFWHDRMEIDDWNAHTNMDVYERLISDGMQQTAVVIASLAYHAAMRDEKLPRVSPLPW